MKRESTLKFICGRLLLVAAFILAYLMLALGNTAHAETTRCASCGTPLIRRKGFSVTLNRLARGGCCPDCTTPLYGRFA